MASNLYSRMVKYSFVERYATVASSQKEANAKFEESMRSNRNEPVGCSYGDLDAEIIEDKCEYEEKDGEEDKERKRDTEDKCLVEYKFNKLEAMRHIEKVHGKKLVVFKTGFAYYDGQPRVFWRLEDQKKEQWDNPNPLLGGGCIDALFFPGEEVVSRKVSVYDETFEFVVRKKRDRIETAKEEKET